MPTRKAPPVKNDAPGMKGERARDKDGTLRRKRGDTKAGTIEGQYGVDLDVRSDKKLSTILEDEGAASLKEVLAKKKKKT